MTLGKPASILFFRVLGIVLVAVMVMLVPDVGPNRVWLVGILLGVHLPIALISQWKLPDSLLAWVEPMLDLTVCVVFIHLVPQFWHTGLVIGLMVALAPSVTTTVSSHRYYIVMGVFLVGGYALAGYVHNVPGWEVPILAIAGVMPAIVFYAYMQAQRADRMRQRAQSLATLNQVAGGVAHDFNNLLTGVLGYAELALADLDPAAPARKSIEEVINGAQRASMLSGQLLAFSRHTVKREDLLDLTSELYIITSLLKPTVPKGVTISLNIADDLPWVHGDRAQLQQVIMNVILNAAEASDHVPCNVSVSMYCEPGHADQLVLEIIDEGKGIAEENLAKIFDPLFTTKLRGHGLGLASAKRIIEAHGGAIRVHSEANNGTVVKITLPAASEANHLVDDACATKTVSGSRVLVIEDDPTVRDVLARLLSNLGLKPLLARDGPQGLAMLQDPTAAIGRIILDLNMPGMDGWQVLDQIRKFDADIPVVICSGYDPEEQNLAGTRAHIHFLQKPFTLDKLRSALTEE